MKRIVILTMLSFVGIALFAIPHPPINLKKGYVSGIVHDQQHLYVAIFGNGLAVVDKATGETSWYTQEKQSFPSNDLIALTLNEGSVWVGDASGYVTSLFAEEPFSKQLFGNAKKGQSISTISFDSNGRMFVSHYGDFKVLSGESVVDEVNVSSSFSEGYIWQMKPDAKGNLWLTDYCANGSHGLTCYTTDGEPRFVLEGAAELPFSTCHVRAMAIDREDHIWFASQTVLVEYDGDAYSTFNLRRTAYDMDFDESGRLWLINSNGILTCFENNETTDYTCPIETNQWHCMDIDGDNIYIATDEGLLLFHDGEFSLVELAMEHTGIEGLESQAESPKTATCYSPAGSVATASTKGIVISEGKKRVRK